MILIRTQRGEKKIKCKIIKNDNTYRDQKIKKAMQEAKIIKE